MESLEQYISRTNSFMRNSIPEDGRLLTNPGLRRKVSEDGGYLPFAGDTVVFTLEKEVWERLAFYQSILYRVCREMLSLPLNPSFFHLTLHDLSNGPASEELWLQSERNRLETEKILEEISNCPRRCIRLKPVSVLVMVNTSIVLGFQPADEDSCRRLMELYDRFQNVVYLDYPLTLHITLAYLKPGWYGEEECLRLAEAFADINGRNSEELILNEDMLAYQRFDNMNCYETIRSVNH